jgi:hypothetical protein
MVRSLQIPSSFYTILLLTLLLSNRVHGFGGVSMNPLLSFRMVTRGNSLTRTYSARTPATKHAHADAEGFTASGNDELMEAMRSLMESHKNDMMDEQRKFQDEQRKFLETQLSIMAKNQETQFNDMMDKLQGMEDEQREFHDTMLKDQETRYKIQKTHNKIMADTIMVDEMQEKKLKALEHKVGILEDKARAEARREFADDFS